MNKLIYCIIGGVILGGIAVVVQSTTKKTTDTAIEQLAEEKIEQEIGKNADVDVNGDTVNITTDDGTASFGTTTSLPADFPSTVPTPKTGSLMTAYGGTENGKKSFALSYLITGTDAATAAATYQDALKQAGFTIQSSGAASSNGTTISGFTGTKANQQINVAVTSDGSTSTTLNLTVTEE